MDNTEINAVEWFFGFGGNHIGLKRCLSGLRLRAVCEIEAAAVEGILEKMEDGRIEPAPIWSDCKTFPTEPFKGRVDLFVASYPCQSFSTAGKRLGKNDPRHLWPYVLDWLRVVRPRQCFFENVEGHVTLGLSTVISDLESSGYKATWGIFSASEVGAPHQRKRVFILANSHSELRSESTEGWIDDAKAGSAGEDVADPISGGVCRGRGSKECGDDAKRIQSDTGERHELRGETEGFCSVLRENVANPDSEGLQGHWGHEQKHGSEGRQDPVRQSWPSRPGEPQYDWEPPRTIDGKLNASWVEKLQGLPIGWTGTGNRIDRLRLLGNGCVPQTVELAYKTLNARFENARI